MLAGEGWTVVEGTAHITVSFAEFYRQHWLPMVRLAIGLVDERAAAEDVVQDAFAAMYRRHDTLRDHNAAVGYLRVCVVNAARSHLRRRVVARRHLRLARDETSAAADESSIAGAERDTVREAMLTLPERQREVLTLRYLVDMSDAEIAAATGLSHNGVRSAASRGLAALRAILGEAL